MLTSRMAATRIGITLRHLNRLRTLGLGPRYAKDSATAWPLYDEASVNRYAELRRQGYTHPLATRLAATAPTEAS